MGRKPRQPKLADLFELDGDYLVAPDKKRLRPALLSGCWRGDSVLLKYWEKSGTPADKDLGHIWRREMRLAERVRARPLGDELLVPVLETGEIDDAFYLVMPGEWRPLAARRKTAKPGHWLQNLHTPAQRLMLWRNVARIGDALDLIHAQRIVHGNIGEWAIFMASDYEPDFRLGGFEWCIRVGEAVALPQQGLTYSFVEDWRAVGTIVEDLLRPKGDGARAPPSLSHNELALIDALKGPGKDTQHFDRRRVRDLLIAVERDCASDKWGQETLYILGARLEKSSLARIIGKATEFAIPADDPQGQRRYMAADLAIGAEIVRLGDGAIWALGEALAYKLSPAGEESAPWRGCTVETAQRRSRLPLGRSEPRPLPQSSIEIVKMTDVKARVAALGTRAGDWSVLVASGIDDDPDQELRLGLTLAEVMLAMFGAAEVLPVELVETRKNMIWLRPAADDTMDGLHKALKVKPTHLQMRDIFELEEVDADAEWILRERPVLGGRMEGSGMVTFSHVEEDSGQRSYAFHLVGSLPPTTFPFLIKTGEGRPQGVVHRRLKLLSALAGQRELCETSSPRRRCDLNDAKP